ncbi:hypothetical protein BC833DRAFT_568616 [Globomyces pollinis-pini]|nr:hypothetical protein BC833DRAFT_568616 [Globomyces pollinis-pini]
MTNSNESIQSLPDSKSNLQNQTKRLSLYKFLRKEFKNVHKPIIPKEPEWKTMILEEIPNSKNVDGMDMISIIEPIDEFCPRWDIQEEYTYLLDSDPPTLNRARTY